jgi:signal transduction histidine kinase
MGRLLNELLELSRIGRKEDPVSEVFLDSIIKNTTDLVAGRIRQSNVKIMVTAPPVILSGYIQRFIQLFQNLIDNAIKFMGNQHDPVVEIGAYTDDEGEVVLFVSDNGSGIDVRHQHKLFGLFEKLNPETEGTGIGLALVKRIVEVHGGRIWFTSEGINKGTTFYFTLKNTRIMNRI